MQVVEICKREKKRKKTLKIEKQNECAASFVLIYTWVREMRYILRHLMRMHAIEIDFRLLCDFVTHTNATETTTKNKEELDVAKSDFRTDSYELHSQVVPETLKFKINLASPIFHGRTS